MRLHGTDLHRPQPPPALAPACCRGPLLLSTLVVAALSCIFALNVVDLIDEINGAKQVCRVAVACAGVPGVVVVRCGVPVALRAEASMHLSCLHAAAAFGSWNGLCTACAAAVAGSYTSQAWVAPAHLFVLARWAMA